MPRYHSAYLLPIYFRVSTSVWDQNHCHGIVKPAGKVVYVSAICTTHSPVFASDFIYSRELKDFSKRHCISGSRSVITFPTTSPCNELGQATSVYFYTNLRPYYKSGSKSRRSKVMSFANMEPKLKQNASEHRGNSR